MLADRLLQAQALPECEEVPEPHAGPGPGSGQSRGLRIAPYRFHRYLARPKLLETVRRTYGNGLTGSEHT